MKLLKDFILNLKRFKTAGILNILGLTVAFTAFAVILFQLAFELGYDKHYSKSDRIYRVETLYPMSLEYIAGSPAPIGDLIKESSPLIEDFFRFESEGSVLIRTVENGVKGEKYKEQLVKATPSIINVLDINVLEGDGKQALQEPLMLMIPQSKAKKLYGNNSAIGQQLYLNGETLFTVAAVYEDFPANTVFNNYFFTKCEESNDWNNWNTFTYILGTSNSSKENLQIALNDLKIDILDQIFTGLHKSEEKESKGLSYLKVNPLPEIYYDTTVIYDSFEKGSRRSSLVMLAIGILIIVIAGINFVNFSTSLAPTRMKSINTQKVLGASRRSLRIKLISEAIFYTLFAFLVSIGLLQLISMTGVTELFSVSLKPFAHVFLLLLIAALAIILGILSGLYPAFYLTSFEPAMVLKGSFVMTPKGIRLRNTLMVFQFIISIGLIIGTLLMNQQNNFMQNYSPGYRTENIGYVQVDGSNIENVEAFIAEIERIPGVLDYTFANYVPGYDMISASGTEIDGEAVQIDHTEVYKNFLSFFEIDLVEGDTFGLYDQETQIILNEMALRKNPVFERYMGKQIPDRLNNGHIRGVAKDVNYLSLRNPINALAYIYNPSASYRVMFFKLSPYNQNTTIDQLKGVFEKLSPEALFNFSFLDQTLQKSYETEQRMAKAISLLGIIAIILALVGVYGLVVFNAQYKRKEISIRKVNGASEKEIMVMLNKNFFRLLILSFIIACPLAWYGISKWLESFSYKISISMWIFLLAGAIIMFLAIFTISWQSWKAATENPVKSLKSE